MTELRATLILLVVAAALIPVGIWLIGAAKRSRRSMASVAGMMMLLGAFFMAEPPPPPPTEAAIPRLDEDENDEPKDPT